MTSQPLRAVLPLLTLVPGGMGGSETYARALVRELANLSGIETAVLANAACPELASTPPSVVLRQFRGRPSTAERLLTMARGVLPRTASRRLLSWAEVVHYPLTARVPPRFHAPRAKVVQTVMDAQHHDLPDFFSSAEKAYRRVAYDAAARSSDAIITISEFCKDRIVQTMKVDPNRVHVAYHGADLNPSPVVGVRDNFVLYPARSWPHKNHARLIDAMGLLRRERPNLKLILTGADRERLGMLPDWVEHRGHVDTAELQALYARAACLAFPSLYEGFGLPPLEAMAAGCPVAAATSGSLPEVCGDAATFFDPCDVPAMAKAIGDAIDRRDQLAAMGLRRARTFTWRACAEVHLAIYERITND